MHSIDFRAVAELIIVLVSALCLFIVKVNGLQTQLRQRVQFVRLRQAVMIDILPESKLRKDRIAAVNDAITIAALLRLVKLG